MEVTERLKNIRCAKERMDNEQLSAEQKRAKEKQEFCNKWLAHSERIKNLIVVAQELCANNIPIGELGKSIGGLPEHKFVSNGIDHRFGFIAHRPYEHSRNIGIYGIGHKGGGCCGVDFVLNESGVAEFSNYYCYEWNRNYTERILCFEKLERKLLEFEKKFYEYVDSL